VTVGETLTEARNQAGLSVDELSERTRIRGTIIRSIEQDDYDACGGDLYVRGYVRAIAGAVGIDAQPLIREYDEARSSGQYEPANGSTGRHARGLPSAPGPGTAVAADAAPGEPAPGEPAPGESAPAADSAAATRFDLSPVDEVPPVSGAAPASHEAGRDSAEAGVPVSEDPAVTAFDLPPITDDMIYPLPVEPVPGTGAGAPSAALPRGSEETRFDLPPMTEDLMAAGYDLRPGPQSSAPGADATSILPPPGADPAGPPAAGPRPPAARDGDDGKGRRTLVGVVVIVLVLAGAGFLGVRLAGGGTASRNTAATSPAAPAASASAPSVAPASASAAASASASATASSSAAPPAAQPATALAVKSATAFGPDGTSDGDNPAKAGGALGGAAQPWSTQWYTTPSFGMLKHGTGLLVSLRQTASVTSVRIYLSSYRGAKLQLRAGTSVQDLHTVATAGNAGGEVKLTLSQPTSARYLLIWFTSLPPDGAGHYAETVSRVVVSGHR
jgi:cytoskeletal protein RodZ